VRLLLHNVYTTGLKMKTADWQQAPKKFLLSEDPADPLNGEEVDLAAFYVDNDLDPDEVNRIGRMQVGDVVMLGGGAAPLFALARVA
jgi:hypothetical protein